MIKGLSKLGNFLKQMKRPPRLHAEDGSPTLTGARRGRALTRPVHTSWESQPEQQARKRDRRHSHGRAAESLQMAQLSRWKILQEGSELIGR